MLKESLTKGGSLAEPLFWENDGPVLLSEVLGWCLLEHSVDTLLVTSRPSEDSEGRTFFAPAIDKAVEAILGKYLIKRFDATGWPGTELMDSSARVYVARFDRRLLDKLVKTEDKLFAWVHWPNNLPEDICVFKEGKSFPSLVSVTHERDAFVLDYRGLRPPPGFHAQRVSLKDYIWGGPYFCRTSRPVKRREHK